MIKNLPNNQKIKLLRKKYKITQNEMASDGISRAYIGLLESGKKPLNDELLRKIIKRFNYIFVNKKIPFRLELDYFSMDNHFEALSYPIINKINGIKNYEELNNLIKNFKPYIYDNYEIQFTIAVKLIILYQFDHARVFLSNLINNLILYKRIDLLASSSTYLFHIIYITKELINNALLIEKLIGDNYKNFDMAYRFKYRFYIAMIESKMNNPIRAISILNELLQEEINDSKRLISSIELSKNYYKAGKLANSQTVIRSLLLHYRKPIEHLYILSEKIAMNLKYNSGNGIKYYYGKTFNQLKENLDNKSEFIHRFRVLLINFKASIHLDKIENAYFLLLYILDEGKNNIYNYEKLLLNFFVMFLNRLKTHNSLYVTNLYDKYLEMDGLKKYPKIGYSFIKYFNKYDQKKRIEDLIKYRKVNYETV